MGNNYSFSYFLNQFSDDQACLEEIKRLRFAPGHKCAKCKKTTYYYKIKNRTAYSCKHCRAQVFPLAGTIFEKSSTPLRLWFYAFYLLTQTKAAISARQLQKELGVTYKTAWRMNKLIRELMLEVDEEMVSGIVEVDGKFIYGQEKQKVHKWTIFNKLVISVVQKDDPTTPNVQR